MLIPDNRDEFRRYDDPEPYFGPAPAALLSGLAAIPDCEIHIVCCSHRPLCCPSKLAGNIYYHCVLVPRWGWMRGAYFGCVSAIRQKLREIKPDLVHGQGTERYCALAAVHSGFPNVLTIHGNMRKLAQLNLARPFSYLWLAAQLEGWALTRTLGVFCNSTHTYQQVAASVQKSWVVPNAVREAFFLPSRGTPRSPPVLLNVGYISRNKSQNELLALAMRLHQRHARFQMQFIGKLELDTPYASEFRLLLKRAQQEGFACYLGEKTESELIELMDGAAGLVHIPKEEAFGLVVAEGLARNLKLFGTRVGGLIDIASGVEGAELFNPGDSAILETAIFKWLASGSPKTSKGAAEMRRRYHPSVIARRHLEIYRQIIDPGQVPPLPRPHTA